MRHIRDLLRENYKELTGKDFDKEQEMENCDHDWEELGAGKERCTKCGKERQWNDDTKQYE